MSCVARVTALMPWIIAPLLSKIAPDDAHTRVHTGRISDSHCPRWHEEACDPNRRRRQVEGCAMVNGKPRVSTPLNQQLAPSAADTPIALEFPCQASPRGQSWP